MTTQTGAITAPRAPLSRERVLRAAIDLADNGGIESLTMRRLGQELGVEAMSLYNHVANKDDILRGIVELVFSEIALPSSDTVAPAGRVVTQRRNGSRSASSRSWCERTATPLV